jgi:hypothetical protein
VVVLRGRLRVSALVSTTPLSYRSVPGSASLLPVVQPTCRLHSKIRAACLSVMRTFSLGMTSVYRCKMRSRRM